MAEKPPSFQHLPLFQRFAGKAIIRGGGSPSLQTVANRANSAAHSTSLVRSVAAKTTSWTLHIEDRKRQKLPVIEEGVPLLLRVDPGFDIDVLRDKFAFEIVSEQEDGFVLVASKDLQLTPFLNMVKAFATATRGSATIASVHQLFEDPSQADRLRSILSESLFAQWPILNDNQTYIFDFGIECTGTAQIPDRPRRGKRDSDSQWAHKELNWSRERSEAYDAWDTIKEVRESEIIKFVSFYKGSILSIIDGADYNAAHLPDSFTVRIQMTGKGMRDLILSYPFTFEVVEPDDIDQPLAAQIPFESIDADLSFTPPSPDAPAICVIDSGIQEEHRLIESAIDKPTSYCFLPGLNTNVTDEVAPGGHGTRVAGAVLYGESIPLSGNVSFPFWVQNARVIDANGRMAGAVVSAFGAPHGCRTVPLWCPQNSPI